RRRGWCPREYVYARSLEARGLEKALSATRDFSGRCSERQQARDQRADVGTQLARRHVRRERHAVRDLDLRAQPRERRRRTSTIFAKGDRQRCFDRVAGTLEEHDVDAVTLLGAADERGELVREDLVRRIDEDVVAIELVGVELRTDILHEIHHEALVFAR